MTFNPFHNLFFTDESQLVSEVVSWFFMVPPVQELQDYVARLPEDVQSMVVDGAGAEILKQLHAEKITYLQENNLAEFAIQLTEAEQLFYLDNLAKYSRNSVLSHIQKSHPTFPSLQFPATMQGWTIQFLKKTNLALMFVSLPEFYKLRVYLHSVTVSMKSRAELEEASKNIETLAAAIQERYRVDQEITDGEQQQERKVLSNFKFLPVSYINDVINKGDSDEKNQLFLDLHLCLQIVITVSQGTDSPQSTPFEKYEVLLLATVKERSKIPFFALLESERHSVFSIPTPAKELRSLFWETITPENISGQKLAGTLLGAYEKLPESLKASFATELYNYLEHDLSVEILAEPLPPDYILTFLRDSPNQVAVQEKVQTLCEGMLYKEYKELAKKLYTQIAEIFQSLRKKTAHV